MHLIKPPTTRTGYKGKLDKLRLLVADAIICNSINRDSKSSDIRDGNYLSELSDQYCLKLFISWLATKYGLAAYTPDNARSDANKSRESRCYLENWFTFAERYPFYSTPFAALPDETIDSAFAFCENNFETDLSLVGALYMRVLSAPLELRSNNSLRIARAGKNDARVRGEFYTPLWLVDYCLEDVNVTAETSVFDPACGSGNFLLGAIRKVRQTNTPVLPFVRDKLFGSDLDPRAVSLAHAVLFLAIADELRTAASQMTAKQFHELMADIATNLREHIRCEDSVVAIERERHGIVITNPPYISYGSRNQTPIKPSQAQLLKQTYPQSSEYKIRLHSIFQELAINRTAEGGDIVLLVPDAFLTGAFYKKLRTMIDEKTAIVSLSELPESTFEDATAGRWCVAHYRNAKADGAQPVRLVSFDNNWDATSFFVHQRELVQPDKHRFQIFLNELDLTLSRKLRQLPVVRTRFRGHTGMRARHGQAGIISPERRGDSWRRGITSGACVRPHKVSWQNEWLDTTAERLFAGGFDPRIVESPKVMVRQTADRLIGAVDTDGLYHLNNVHSFAAQLDQATLEDLHGFAGLLNSRFWLYLYQLKSREHKRALAQIDIEMVEAMPLPDMSSKAGSELSDLVRSAQNGDAGIDLLKAIDLAVYKMYELSRNEIEHIEATLHNRGVAY